MLSEQIVGDLAIPRSTSASRSYLITKRAMDVTLSALALIVLAPVLLVLAVLIRLDSPGPVVFRQTRIGRFGRPFTCYKFRTMVAGADEKVHRAYIQAYAQGHATSTGDPDRPFKLVRDARVTRLGRWLRRTSLDELPQLVNVLQGHMSLVGPRPDVPYSVALYKDWHKLRLATQPGLTGLWQVEGRGRVSYDEGMRLDCDYVRRQSFWLDVIILAKTIPAVLSQKGAA
jgi:lipopolysaccharide/colanic/teichoic acid biosynthesis glycosyltransferase